MSKKVRTAVLPVAGLGTRFLPATSALPKEMLTVVDRPVIDYVVEEALAAGIERFVFVTGRNKGIIEDHFDRQYELEDTLERRGKTADLERLRSRRLAPGQAFFTRQQDPKGLGHAIWCARELVGDEPFAVLLPDVIVQDGSKGCLARMMGVYDRLGGNVLAVEEVPGSQTHNYGVVGVEGDAIGQAQRITAMVEKPAPGTAPSNLIILGRYILQPEIFAHLGMGKTGAGGEIQLTDAMLAMLGSQDFFAVAHRGRSFDCGSKLGLLAANVAYALSRPDLREGFEEVLADVVAAQSPDVLRRAMWAMHGIAFGTASHATAVAA